MQSDFTDDWTKPRDQPITTELFPRHDEFSILRQAWSVLCLAMAAELLVQNIVRLSGSPHMLQWWLPLAVLAGLVAADLVSGLVHGTADTWGSETMPILGRRFLHPFRVHHAAEPQAIDKNFSVHSSLWDWLFGTIYLADRWPNAYGLCGQSDVPLSWMLQFVYPFWRRAKANVQPQSEKWTFGVAAVRNVRRSSR